MPYCYLDMPPYPPHTTQTLTKHPLGLLTLPIDQIDRPQHIGLIRFHDVPVHDHLVQQKMHLFQLIHDIEFAYRPGPSIHGLHQRVYEFQQSQFVLVILHFTAGGGYAGRVVRRPRVDIGLGPHDEEQTGVPSVDDFEAAIFEEGALEFGAGEAFAYDFRFERDAFRHVHPFVVGGEAGLALFVAVRVIL